VVAFANRTRATAEEFAALAQLPMDCYTSDYRTLLRRNDVDAVLVCVPIPQLLSIARESLEVGKHVICEKPPGVDLAEAREFLVLVDQHPRQKFMMTENFFYRDDLRPPGRGGHWPPAALAREMGTPAGADARRVLDHALAVQAGLSRRPAAGRGSTLDRYDPPLWRKHHPTVRQNRMGQ
jgi:hypothetical protein